MILQMVWNECVRFGGHTNIQVSYKILQLEILKKALILHNPTYFQEGLFLSSFRFYTGSCVNKMAKRKWSTKWQKENLKDKMFFLGSICRILL
jgi:hypothetical protein